MAASYVTIEIDSDTRDAASDAVEYFGLDLASVTRAFYKQIVREHRIPITLSDPEPNDESLEAIRETEKLKAANGPGYRTGAELLAAIQAEWNEEDEEA